jgi:hypothetical protein
MAGETTMVMLDAKGDGLEASFNGEGRFKMDLGERLLNDFRVGEQTWFRKSTLGLAKRS